MPAGIRLRQNSIESPKTHDSTLTDLKGSAAGNPSSVPLRQSAADLSTRQSINDFSDYRGDCLEKYPYIQQKRTAPRIGNVKAYHFLVCCLVLSADLP